MFAWSPCMPVYAHGKIPLSSPPPPPSARSEGGIRKLLFSRRCRRLIKMVNCLRGGNDDKEGKRRKGQSVFAGFLGRFSFSPPARVTWDSSFVRRRRRLILRSFNTATALSGSSKELPDLPLAPHPLFCSFVPSRVSSSSLLFSAAVQTRARTRVSLSAEKHFKISRNLGCGRLLNTLFSLLAVQCP